LRRSEARRVALAAQGFGKRPNPPPRAATLLRTIRRLGLLQIDSVNVLVRSHYLPLFSRLGAYDRSALDGLAYGKTRNLYEYWAHEASLVPLETFPFLRWRMERARRGLGIWQGLAEIARDRPALVESVEAELRRRGPLSASDFENAVGSGSWWGWSDVKRALEYSFRTGTVTTRTRRPSFERVYDLTERVFPQIYAARVLDEASAQRELVRIAARAFGVATESDLRDYFRLQPADSKARVAELVELGELVPVAIEGWKSLAYLDAARALPRKVAASALLSPFDSLVWHRPRTSRLFDFEYRLEIYTPSHKRVHGYYVLPYLVDEALVARVDLKAERTAGILRVQAIHYEAQANRGAVLERLKPDLAALAAWLGLEGVAYPSRTA
jgi:uncharacterized protein YcaQ